MAATWYVIQAGPVKYKLSVFTVSLVKSLFLLRTVWLINCYIGSPH